MTPPPIVIEHARHDKALTQKTLATEHHKLHKEKEAKEMETIEEDDEPILDQRKDGWSFKGALEQC